MIIFKNAKILTMQNDKIIDGQVEVEKNKIVYVGKERATLGEEIDCKGKILMPGLINMHAHSAMTKFWGVGENENLQDWLFNYIFPLEAQWTKEGIYENTKKCCEQYIDAGITTVVDNYFEPTQTTKAYLDCGLRSGACLGATQNKNVNRLELLTKQYNDMNEQFDLKNNQLLFSVAFAHSVYTLSEKDIGDYVSFCKEKNILFGIHISETLQEMGECDKQNGCTPSALCEKIGCFDRPSFAVHCVHLDKSDYDILKDNNVSVVSCPASNSFLASGIAPIYSLHQKGINICLGTDGASSTGKLDMFREMYLTYILQKLWLGESKCLSAYEVLKMATVNGAKALNFDNLGKIEKGCLADIIVVDTSKAKFYPNESMLLSLVCVATGEDVALTMCNGKILKNSL